MAEWIQVGLAFLTLMGVFIAMIVRVSRVVSDNTNAIINLTTFMSRQEQRTDEHGVTLGEHENRITVIETTHKILGCAEAE